MNSPRGTGLMKNYEMESGETHKQVQPLPREFILSKSQAITLRDAITRFLNYNPNEENLSVILMENRFSATIVRNPSQIMHTTVYDTLSQCTGQGVQNPIPNRHGSR